MRNQLIAIVVITAIAAAELSAQPPGRGKFGGERGVDPKQAGPGGMQLGGPGTRGPAAGGPGKGGGPGGARLGGGGMASRMIQTMPLYRALDRDGDGTLSESEIRNASTAIKRLDKNKNGVIDADELAPDRTQMRGGNRGPGGGGPGVGGPGKGRGPGQNGMGKGGRGPGGGGQVGGAGGFRGGQRNGGGVGAKKPNRPGFDG